MAVRRKRRRTHCNVALRREKSCTQFENLWHRSISCVDGLPGHTAGGSLYYGIDDTGSHSFRGTLAAPESPEWGGANAAADCPAIRSTVAKHGVAFFLKAKMDEKLGRHSGSVSAPMLPADAFDALFVALVLGIGGLLFALAMAAGLSGSSRYVLARWPTFLLFTALLLFSSTSAQALNNLLYDKGFRGDRYSTTGCLLLVVYPLTWLPFLRYFRADADPGRVGKAARFVGVALATVVLAWLVAELDW